MKHLRIVIAIFTFTLFAESSIAKYSDDFVLGAYSELRSHNIGSGNFSVELAHLMKQARFNSAIGTAVYDSDQQKVEQLSHHLDADSLDLILEDHIFVPGVQYGYSALSTGVFMRFEAEYCSQDSIIIGDENSDSFFYKSIDRVGEVANENTYSRRHYWHIPSDLTGYAYKDLLYRWPLNDGTYYRIGPEFRFLRSNVFGGNTSATSDNCLYVRYVFKTVDISNLADTDTLATFTFTSYDDPTTIVFDDEDYPNSRYVPGANEPDVPEKKNVWFRYGSDDTFITRKILTKGEYANLQSANNTADPSIKSITFRFPIELPGSSNPNYSLVGQDVVTPTSWYWQLKNLNPLMWWHGNGQLMLDYVEFSDKVFNEFTDTPAERNRLRNYDFVSNLSYQYGIDEPKTPHYRSFRILDDHLETQNGIAILTASSFEKSDVKKTDGTPFRLTKAYIEEVQPRALMIDRYPFINENVFWNGTPGAYGFVQSKLDSTLAEYEYYRDLASLTSMKLFMVPQIYGEWDPNQNKWSYLLPPGKMAKCLQLLPLCYNPDGIVSFKFDTSRSNQYTMVKHGYNSSDFALSPLYYEVMEANRKIRTYGPMIKSNNWDWEEVRTICLNTESFNSPYSLVNHLVVEEPEDTHDFYGGYIQAALYLEDQFYPSYMLVNRRTVRVRNNALLNLTPPDTYHQIYAEADSQIVVFQTNGSAQNLYGNHVALFDPYDKSIYRERNSQIKVPIGPGDGRLMQICSTLPQIVTGNQNLAHFSVLCNQVALADSAQVSISAGSKTLVLPDTDISIQNGCTFTFRGTVDFGDNVRIHVEPGGNLSFQDAVCTWGVNSIIEVEGATLSIIGASFNKCPNEANWAGIRATSSSNVILNDLVISNANRSLIDSSNIQATNCRFNIPANGFGLLISNIGEANEVRISNTQNGKGFFGESYQNSRGIVLGSTKIPVCINSVYFHNLATAIWKNSNVSVRDSITYCSFDDCNTGINIISRDYAGVIKSCNFNQTVQDSTASGIRLIAANPRINDCYFNVYRGILTEYSIGTFSRDSGIFNCNFNNNHVGIESRGSNHRLEQNYFNSTRNGIVCRAKSNLNLQDTANNVFVSQISNVKFFDEQPYDSWLQLLKGHNDFYHQDTGNDSPATDFEFDPQYFGYPWSNNCQIIADGNWFQDFIVKVNDPLYSGYLVVDDFDPEPNMPAPPPENDRFITAMGLESQGLYEMALDLYKAILTSPLVTEQCHLSSAADGVYRLSELINDPNWNPTGYFDAKILQYEIDNPHLSGLLKDYLAKLFIVRADFQSAVDLIQMRLDNPISEVDSLLAVLDLEVVLQLAALEEDKKPLTTKYAQFKYHDMQTFKSNHDLHWTQLCETMYQNPDALSVPSDPIITRSYPNPFNPSTTLDFSTPKTGKMKLNVFNLRGQKVRELINSDMESGFHKIVWDGRDNNNCSVSSGIYFIRLESGGKDSIRKVMLLK